MSDRARGKKTAWVTWLTPELLGMIELRPEHENLRAALTGAAAQLACDTAWALIGGAHVLGAWGAVPLGQGRGVAWLLLSPHVRPRHVLQITALLAEHSAATLAAGKFQRLEATTRADFVGGRHVLEHAGYECEGLLRRYADGVDHLMYSRITA